MMQPPRKKRRRRIDDFVVDDDAASISSTADYEPTQTSPSRAGRQLLLTGLFGRQTSPHDEDPETDEEQDPEREASGSLDSPAARPQRGAAVNAAPQIRHYARADIGEVSDLAEDDESDEDEMDADAIQYAPFETQVAGDEQLSQVDDIPECEDIGDLPNVLPEGSDHFVKLVEQVERDGFVPLIDEVLKVEHRSGSKFGEFLFAEAPDYWKDMCLLTLCSMPERVIQELTYGNLKQAYETDAELKAVLDRYQARGKEHPSIYARVCTRDNGELMTIEQARRVVKWLSRYISEDPAVKAHRRCVEAFRRIDSAFRGQWRPAGQKPDRSYLATNSTMRSDARVRNVRLFCQQLLAECDRCEAANKPLKPLLYIGFAAKADRRKRQHEACGQSSNWLATLVQAICNVLWGRGVFKMHFFVICLLHEELQGMAAEMLLTRIPGAYYNAGGGFCIDVAGKSMESIYFKKLSAQDSVDHWNELSEWIDQNTPLVENLDLHRTRVEILQRRKKIAAEAEQQGLTPRQRITKAVSEVKNYYDSCQKLKNDLCWQTEEGRRWVRESEELWGQMKERFPDYV
ncbi:hypothetical protein BU26DRAFT_569382 [Trematosphaeria pertusa]|uniref:Uncharacterized protein n=1 Tax=Trematosphaeria pertusa TaxID=390896 RepID=A0A6A6I467_9PLEO|nr:uncharacterized protein BU26DRAFT_569382 [Trematosphaeria pertusa]KAF2244400.1 hypothetical protein BU26DRAFT_569382 [Trematosphaeria pertusa]